MKKYIRQPRGQNGGVWPDKRWRIWYWRRSVNGKRKLTRIGTFDEFTKAEAEKHYWQVILPKQTGQAPKQTTFADVAQRYMTHCDHQAKRRMEGTDPEAISPITAKGYRNNLEKYAIPKWGEFELEKMANPPDQIKNWLTSLDRAPKTKAHVRGVMQQVFAYAIGEGSYPLYANPMSAFKIKGATKRQKRIRTLTVDEFNAFIDSVPAKFVIQRTAIYTCMILGLRREEVWALKWSDFDFVNDLVTIQRVIIGGIVYEKPKTEASEAQLPVNKFLKALLLEWRSKSEFNQDSDWLWASPSSAGEMPLYMNAVHRDYIIPAATAAGIGKIGWHALRHTYKDWLDEGGETELSIQQKLMRHSRPDMTAKYGSKKVNKAMRKANERIGELLMRETPATVN